MIFTPNHISEDILGIKIAILLEKITGISRKTYTSWFDGTKHPYNNTLINAFDKYNSKMESDFGINPDLNIRMYKETETGPTWKTLFEHPINRNSLNHIPETIKLILFFENKTIELKSFFEQNNKEEVKKCFESCDLPALNLMKYFHLFYGNEVKNKQKNERIYAGLKSKITLYCIASLDAELFSLIDDFSVFGELGETYKKRKSYFCSLLPELKNDQGEIMPPLKNWFEKVKAKSGYKSWEKLAEALGNKPELEIPNISDRDIRRYKKGEFSPLEKIKLILKGLFSEDEQSDGLMYYFIALIFQYFYDIIQDLDEVDTLEFFDEYNKYINCFTVNYTAPVSQR